MAGDTNQKEAHRLRFIYQYGSLYRAIHVDGAFGGVSLTGRHIAMNVFHERRPFPETQEIEVGPRGKVNIETLTNVPTLPPGDVVREMEAALIMDYETAVAVRDWLTQKVAQMEEFAAELKANAAVSR